MKKLLEILKNPWFARIYLIALVIGVSSYFYSNGDYVLEIIRTTKPKPHWLILAMTLYFFDVGILNPLLHSIAYKEIGGNVSFWQAFRIFHLSRIGNYLPGRIWFATNYYLFSKKINIENEKILKNYVVLNALLFLVGGICSLPILTSFSPIMQKLLIVFPFLMAVIIHPRVFKKIFKPILGNKDTGQDFKYSFLAKASILYFFTYVVLGLALYFATVAFAEIEVSHLSPIIASSAASVLVGMLAIFAPAGIGVSEGINAAILSMFIPMEVAVMVVVSFRVLIVFVDFGCALVSAVSVARDEKKEKLQQLEI